MSARITDRVDTNRVMNNTTHNVIIALSNQYLSCEPKEVRMILFSAPLQGL